MNSTGHKYFCTARHMDPHTGGGPKIFQAKALPSLAKERPFKNSIPLHPNQEDPASCGISNPVIPRLTATPSAIPRLEGAPRTLEFWISAVGLKRSPAGPGPASIDLILATDTWKLQVPSGLALDHRSKKSCSR